MAATWDAVATNNDTVANTSLTWAHTPVGLPSLVLVKMSWRTSTSAQSATHGGVAMTPIFTGGDGKYAVWKLINPLAGVQTVSVSWTTGSRSVGASESYLGALAPDNLLSTDAGTFTTDSLNVLNMRPIDLAVSFVGGTDATSVTWTGTGTETYDLKAGVGAPNGAGYWTTGSGTVAMSVTSSSGPFIASHVVARIPGVAGGPMWFF